MIRAFLFLSMLAIFPSYAQVDCLLQEEALVLETFFRTLFEKLEGGYVLFDQKPVCWHGALLNKSRIIGTVGHRNSVALYEGLHAWKRLEPYQSKFYICARDFENPSRGNKIEITFMNKMLLERVISKELALFQSKLGTIVPCEYLVDALLKSGNLFYSTLKDDKVLVGILLGFGTDNAVKVGRIEDIEQAFFSLPEIPPFQRKQNLIPHLYHRNKNIFLYFPCNTSVESHLTLEPSFGFSTINEEFLELSKEITVSSPQLNSEPAPFIFGWSRDNPENWLWIEQLEATQKRIRTLLNNQSFLGQVLNEITGKQFLIENTTQKKLPMDPDELENVNFILAHWIWNELHLGDEEEIHYFIEGFLKPVAIVSNSTKIFSLGNKAGIERAKRNLDESNQFFLELHQDTTCHCIIPARLYYRVIQKGKGSFLDDPFRILVDYMIYHPKGGCLAENNTPKNVEWMDLSQTIPGFAYGLKGMEVGETRELWIHPSLGYGIFSNLEKGIYLRVCVTLKAIDEVETSFPEFEYAELDSFEMEGFKNILKDNYREMAFIWGSRLGKHLSKNRQVDIKEIISFMKLLYENDQKYRELTESEKNTINKIHWNIYFSNT